MATQDQWSTTVHYLMLNFRDALVAIVPYMDRVKVGWRDEEAYDDWDDISQTLYENMVIGSIRCATESLDEFVTPEYGMVYPSYRDKSFIGIAGGMSQSSMYKIFVGFSTLEHPFDQLRYQIVSSSDFRAVGEMEVMPLGEAKFIFILNKGTGEPEEILTLLVEV